MKQQQSTQPAWTSTNLAVIVLFCMVIVATELTLVGADYGFWGFPDWRSEAYRHGAFWSGLLDGWPPLYRDQPWLMFLTHAFLHSNAMHAVFNLATLVSLGVPVLREAGALRFIGAYAATLIGGCLAFTLLGPADSPMVGASGALFGLAGVVVAWNAMDAWRAGDGLAAGLAALMLPTVILVLLNIVMDAMLSGHLAWQTHLGGYVAGLGVAQLIRSRPMYTIPA